jgi:hypothetical protein
LFSGVIEFNDKMTDCFYRPEDFAAVAKNFWLMAN